MEQRPDVDDVRVGVARLAHGLIEPVPELLPLLRGVDVLVVLKVVAKNEVGPPLFVPPSADLLARAQRLDLDPVREDVYKRQLFEQYVQKGTNFPELRAQLLEEYRAGAELTGPQGLRRKLGAVDLGYFGRAYLPHYFVRPSPPFHEELDRIFREGVMKGLNPATDAKEISRADGCRRAVEAPRGHAKSTNFTFKDSIHSAVYAYKHYEIILSDSSEQAEGFQMCIRARSPALSAIGSPGCALKEKGPNPAPCAVCPGGAATSSSPSGFGMENFL